MRKTLLALLLLASAGVAHGQVQLRDGFPQQYTVVSGDTLWDISGKFLRLSPLTLAESRQLRLARVYPGSIYKSAASTVLVALPKAAAWNPSESTPVMGDTSTLAWVSEAVTELAANPKVSKS